MTKDDLLAFLRTQKWAVEASVSVHGGAQAALVGVGVTDELELVFDTIASSRKAVNLKANPNAAFVIGGWMAGDERTVQVEGIVDFPLGEVLDRVKAAYFAVFPDGPSRLAWPGITHARMRPTWIRFSDYRVTPPVIEEFTFDAGSENTGSGLKT
jgi:pyridoxine/pyridoxamine 5'-phosphate oxidase